MKEWCHGKLRKKDAEYPDRFYDLMAVLWPHLFEGANIDANKTIASNVIVNLAK